MVDPMVIPLVNFCISSISVVCPTLFLKPKPNLAFGSVAHFFYQLHGSTIEPMFNEGRGMHQKVYRE